MRIYSQYAHQCLRHQPRTPYFLVLHSWILKLRAESKKKSTLHFTMCATTAGSKVSLECFFFIGKTARFYQVGLATSAFSMAQMVCCPLIVSLSSSIGLSRSRPLSFFLPPSPPPYLPPSLPPSFSPSLLLSLLSLSLSLSLFSSLTHSLSHTLTLLAPFSHSLKTVCTCVHVSHIYSNACLNHTHSLFRSLTLPLTHTRTQGARARCGYAC